MISCNLFARIWSPTKNNNNNHYDNHHSNQNNHHKDDHDDVHDDSDIGDNHVVYHSIDA